MGVGDKDKMGKNSLQADASFLQRIEASHGSRGGNDERLNP